jgi:hypothetical protein
VEKNDESEDKEDIEFRKLVEELDDKHKPTIKLEYNKFMGVDGKNRL